MTIFCPTVRTTIIGEATISLSCQEFGFVNLQELSSEGDSFTPSDVERALWSFAVGQSSGPNQAGALKGREKIDIASRPTNEIASNICSFCSLQVLFPRYVGGLSFNIGQCKLLIVIRYFGFMLWPN